MTDRRQPSDTILFAGNRHETVPRALFTDYRLTPLERNAWQVCRLMLREDGISAFPTYERLRPYLASTPCSNQASDETIARALTLLRLTRWLSLVRNRRDRHSGRIQGNLYVLHDDPLTPYEAIQLDPNYLSLVSHALTHASKAIQRMGYHTLREVTEDPLLNGRVLPSRMQLLMTRLASQGWTALQDDSPAPASDSEEGSPRASDALRNPKEARAVRTVRTKTTIDKDVRTLGQENSSPPLRLPEGFSALRAEQQAGALAALQKVDVRLRQLILDEWAARCQTTPVRNPAGYLFGLVQRALRGDFHASAGRRAPTPAPAGRPAAASNCGDNVDETDRQIAQEHLAKLRNMVHGVQDARHKAR